MGLGRVELPTSPLSGVRSSHLSYRPGTAYNHFWWSWSGSNRRPPECKSGALPAELQPPKIFRGRLDARTMSQAHGHFLKLPYSYRDFRNGIHDLAIAVGVERLPARTLTLTPPTFSLRKEVIQPQVLLRLPCYDFTPIMNHTLGRCSPCGSACGLLVQSTFVM